jgi:quercetin dioxygenase-like cupin family protein
MKVQKMSEVAGEPAVSALFSGDVVRRTPFMDDELHNVAFGIISFGAGSRNKYHTHTSDQILVITEGTGVIGTHAGDRVVTAGDVVLVPAGENHWHGAPGQTSMAHITIMAKDSTTTLTEGTERGDNVAL